MKLATAVFLLCALPAVAQKLPEDAVPDCQRGPVILKRCEADCRAKLRRQFMAGAQLQNLNAVFMQCLASCDGIRIALEECNERQ